MLSLLLIINIMIFYVHCMNIRKFLLILSVQHVRTTAAPSHPTHQSKIVFFALKTFHNSSIFDASQAV